MLDWQHQDVETTAKGKVGKVTVAGIATGEGSKAGEMALAEGSKRNGNSIDDDSGHQQHG